MRLFRLIALTVALGAFLSVPALTAAADDYTAYVACGYRTSAPPATSCAKSGRIAAFFKSNNATVNFKTCVTFPNGETQCTRQATATKGVYYRSKLTVGSRGTLTVRWKVGGVVVATYSIRVTR
jgi:hypothetical protein